jgi:hypothetical protein
MDLHNNAIGIQFFESLLPGIHRQFFETSFFINGLSKKRAMLYLFPVWMKMLESTCIFSYSIPAPYN